MSKSFQIPPLPRFSIGQIIYAEWPNGNGSIANYAGSIIGMAWHQKLNHYDESCWIYRVTPEDYTQTVREDKVIAVLKDGRV